MSSGDGAREQSVGALHRQIELQAPEDLAYLLANVRRAAAARLDEAFPPVDGAQGEDELRTSIEQLVDEYISKTFTLASPNLSINGMPVDPNLLLSSSSSSNNPPSSSKAKAKSKLRSSSHHQQPEEVYAPFDARLRARVEDLTREEEDLLRDIAALKKSVPAAAAARWGEATKRGVREDEEGLAARIEETAAAGLEGAVKELERQAEVEKSYGNAVQGLARLKREMPGVVARMERARGAGGYVVTGK